MKKRRLMREINELRLAMNTGSRRQSDATNKLVETTARLTTRMSGLNDRVDAVEAGRAVDIRAKAKLLDDALGRLGSANVDEMLKKLNWLHDRLDLIANRQDAITQQLTRVAYAVGQFDARLVRLEAPPPPKQPRKRAGKAAGAKNGPTEPPEPNAT